MRSWLASVGIGSSWYTQKRLPGVDQTSEARADTEVCDLLPDFVAVAASLEQGVLQIQEEARSLESASLIDALKVIRMWSGNLRKRPRADDNLASFRAQFLRSNALETALEALRRNKALCSIFCMALPIADVLDAPSGEGCFSSDSRLGPQAALVEICQLVQLCLPKAASGLVRPVVAAIFSNSVEGCAGAIVSTIAKLREEWIEVVRSQAIRGLERRLDSLTYDLQKRPLPSARNTDRSGHGSNAPLTRSQRQTLHDQVIVLTALCEALASASAQAEERSRETRSALAELGSKLEELSSAAQEQRSRDESIHSHCHPGISDCELAMTSMLTKTVSGMSQGLALLGLPNSPLQYTPGAELVVRGHDVRSDINSMMEHWVEEDISGFLKLLQKVRKTVDKVKDADDDLEASLADSMECQLDGIAKHLVARQSTDSDSSNGIVESDLAKALLARRAVVNAQRHKLLAQLRDLDAEISFLDEQLVQTRHASCDSACSSTQAPSSANSDKTGPTSECSETSCNGGSSPSPLQLKECSLEALAQVIASQMSVACESLSSESQRHGERLRVQLQQRRSQLLLGLASHIDSETHQLSCKMPCGAAARSERPLTTESIEIARYQMQEIRHRIEAVVPGSKLSPAFPKVGARCRAKWMDGYYYDAEVQSVLRDGTSMVNWLRGMPEADPPLVTVSERGGDDTLARIVPHQDLWLTGGGSIKNPPEDVKEAQRLFNNRSDEDQCCVECGRPGCDWASVSFGIFLCSACADVHRVFGPRKSLLRALDDGWGWSPLDLAPLRLGGNTAFKKSLESFPAVRSLPIADRYSSRFAEFYRRHLDAICANTQPPQVPTEVVASAAHSDFLSVAEAAAIANEASRLFMEAATTARERVPVGKVAACRPARLVGTPQPQIHSETGRYSEGI